jgi:hypothetical protein
LSTVVMRPSRSADMPTCSGAAVARGWSSRAKTGSDGVVTMTAAASAIVAAKIFHLPKIFDLAMTFLP